MDSLGFNDTCKRPITNLKRHFVCGDIIQMHTIHDGNQTVIKQPRNGNRRKKLTKNSQVYISFQAQLMG